MQIAFQALDRYGQREAAFREFSLRLKRQWVDWHEEEFARSGTLHEKAPYTRGQVIDEGFYGNLPGFGWTVAAYLTALHDLARAGRLGEG
jgi:neutral trehalase